MRETADVPGEPLAEPAPAKINLALHVTGRRADGYHLLHSLCVFTQLGDEVSARPAASDRLSLGGPFAGDLSAGRSNLAFRALERFRARFPGHLPEGVALHLEKRLPVAAGLGGGSADAAAVLRLLARMGDGPVEDVALYELAEGLGADVPMCLYGKPCEVSGIGERIRPVAAMPSLHLVLVNPMVELATAQVFRRLEGPASPPLPPLPEPMGAAMLALWLRETRNDLQAPAVALVPAIALALEAVERTQAVSLARMSGSGATVFGLYGSAASAHEAARVLRGALEGHWVAATPILID